MDVLALTTAGYGGRLCFLDETSLCYASGHGVVIHDKDTGLQKHIWTLPEGHGHPPANMGPATFATCPGGHLLAYVQQGGLQQQIQVVQQDTLLPASTIKDPGARHIEFAQLVFDAEGTRLLSIGGAPDNQLDVWDVDSKEPLVRLTLPDSLTGLEAAFFPLNSEVLAVAGPDAARVLWDEPLVGTRVLRQSEVELAVLAEGERLTCIAWTPNGTLLMGTNAGRLLGAKGAAPPAVPTGGWGEQLSGGHLAELLYGSPSPPPPPPLPPSPLTALSPVAAALANGGVAPPKTGVTAVVPTATHVLLVMSGDTETPAQLVWLSPQTLAPVGTAALSLHTLVRAVASPSCAQLAIAADDGSLSLCTTACPASLAQHSSSGSHSAAESSPSLSNIHSGSQSGGAAGVGSVSASVSGAVTDLWAIPPSPRTGGRGGDGGGGGRGGSPVGEARGGSGSRSASLTGMAGTGTQVQVSEVARFHRGRIVACVWLSHTRLVTGGSDGSVRLWSYVPSDADPPDPTTPAPSTAPAPTPALLLEAVWHVSQGVTCMVALNPPTGAGVESASGGFSDSGVPEVLASLPSGRHHGGGAGGSVVPLPPAFLIGTAGGVVQLVNTDRVPAVAADATDVNQLVKSLAATWEVRLFNGPVTAAAFSQEGNYCAVSCAAEGKVAFLRIMVLGHEISMRVLGFYPMREPKHLAWAPPEPGGGGIHPMLVVGSILGEVVVLGLPDASAIEEASPDGVLTRGSLVKATMRAQSHITSLAVYPSAGAEARAGGGHFWVFTAHTDKSIRRYRMCTDQQKSAAAVAARASAVAAAAASSTGTGTGSGDGVPAAASASPSATNSPYRGGGPSGSGASLSRQKTMGLGRAISMASAQNFQMPECEKQMELQLSATAISISLVPGASAGGGGGGAAGGISSASTSSSTGVGVGGYHGPPLRMAVAAADGSVALYKLPEISLQGRWLLHEMASGGASAVCLLGDRLLSAGGEGSVQVLELSNAAGRRHATHRASHMGAVQGGALSGVVSSSGGGVSPIPGARPALVTNVAAQRSAFFTASGPPRPRGMERATLGILLPVHSRALLPGIHTGAEGAPTWQQARTQAIQQMHREQLSTFRARAQAKCREWAERIRQLKELNEAADEVERLTPEEFVVDVGLRREMLAAGEARYAAVKAHTAREMLLLQFKRQRLREQCMGAMESVARPLVSLPEYAFVTAADSTDTTRKGGAAGAAGGAAAGRAGGGGGDTAAAAAAGGGGAGAGAGTAGGGGAAGAGAEGGVVTAKPAASLCVWSYGMRQRTQAEQLRLRQVMFLRKVEQAESAQRYGMERGAVVPVRRYKGDMQRKFHLNTEEEAAAAAAAAAAGQQPGQGQGQGGAAGQQGQGQGGPLSASQVPNYDEELDMDDEPGPSGPGGLSKSATRRYREDGYEGTELSYGETGLLYADVQLYTHCRRAAQVVLIQEELRCLRRLFNTRWSAARTAKQKALDRIDERLGRITEIHRELTKLALEEGAWEPPQPCAAHVPGNLYYWTPQEEMVALAEVRDDEVKVAKYVSPEEKARRAAAAAAEDAARRRAEADDARNRALREMMNSNPAVTRNMGKRGKNRLVREAWMDIPPGQMSKEQRQKLAEWERKVTEHAEELEKQRRLLEAERRALEVEIVDTAAAANADLARLNHAKVRMDMEVVHLERRAVDLAGVSAALAASDAVRLALVGVLGALTGRRTRRAPLLAALEQRVARAQRAFDDIAFSEKQVDKAFRREYSSRPELWDDAQKVYRARSHLLQAFPSTGSGGIGEASGGGPGRGGGGSLPATPLLPRKTALELLSKTAEGVALAAALEVPPPAETLLSRTASTAAPSAPISRQQSLARALSRRATPLDSLGGAGGVPGPDILLVSPRPVVRDMAHLARPKPQPGSPLHEFARRHLVGRPASPLEDGPRSFAAYRSMSAPPMRPPTGAPGELVSETGEGEAAAAAATGAAGAAATAGGAASIGGGTAAGGGMAISARRGVPQRAPGLRLRALAERSGRPLDSLLQMVADGLPASALSSDLGPLGLQLPGNPPGNLDPFKVEAPIRVFNPEVTGAAEALVERVAGSGGSGGGSMGAERGGHSSPTRERSSASGGRSTNTGSVSPTRGEEASPEEEEEDPLDSRERPEGMEDALWIRLLEFRQTRADLEKEAEESWRKVSLLTAQLDWIELEESEMEAQVEEAGARAAALREGAARMALDVSLTYRLKNGQVELSEKLGDVMGVGDQLADAVILHRNRIEALNEEVLSRGEGKIELLDTLRYTRRKIHLTQWEAEAAELSGRHAAQRLTELQLLHVTKDLQAVLRDPTIVDRLNDEARLAVVWQSAANLHTHRLEQRKRQAAALFRRVSRSGAEQGELTVAEAAAESAFQDSTRMHTMVSHAKAEEDASHRRHMRNIVTNAQLRAIALQQGAELERLAETLRSAHGRSFPTLVPGGQWTPPDYRPPPAAAAAAAAAAVVGPSGDGRTSPPGSRGGLPSRGSSRGIGGTGGGSRPPSAAMALPGVAQRTMRPSGGGGGGGVGSPPATPPLPRSSSGLTRSGGAGATLTRAYAASATPLTAADGSTPGGPLIPPHVAAALGGGGGGSPGSGGGAAAATIGPFVPAPPRPTSGFRPSSSASRRR